ncbi:MAG: efflux RND transporter periplasmic adaptor subunit [Candidatus Omnitrophota bacterium]
MKNKKLVLFILVASGTLLLILFIFGRSVNQRSITPENEPVVNQEGKIGKKKLLYYRNPMDPEVTSPVPMKDSMGMDYIAVYAAEESGASPGVYINSERQQLIGVKKEAIVKRQLVRQIMTVGKVAYDPDLYVAQEEYIQSLKTAEATKNSALVSVSAQSNSFADASRKKLLLLGMSKEEIEALAKRGQAQENLYLPDYSDTVWVYLTIYEYEIGLVKAGQEVTLDASAFPGEVFQGKVMAITPVLNVETRSLRVRVEVNDLEHKLKPEMFVNAKINIDLGERLAVLETAVLDTGIRKIVYLIKDDDSIELREVNLGQKAQGYYEVLDGLKVGDIVVTSGNFLVDSESRLKSALTDPSHEHNQ